MGGYNQGQWEVTITDPGTGTVGGYNHRPRDRDSGRLQSQTQGQGQREITIRDSGTGTVGGYNHKLRDRNSGRLQSGTPLIQINDHPVCANYCTSPSSNYQHPGRIDRTVGLMGFL